MNSATRLADVLSPHRAVLLIVSPLGLLEVGLDGAMTLSYKFLIDYAIVPCDKQALVTILGLLAAIIIGGSLTTFWRDFHYARIAVEPRCSSTECRSSPARLSWTLRSQRGVAAGTRDLPVRGATAVQARSGTAVAATL